MRRIFAIFAAWPARLARPFPAVAVAMLGALALLVPGLSTPGLWEPQELARADVALARLEAENKRAEAQPPPTPAAKDAQAAPQGCRRQAPPDALARSLPERALTAAMRAGHTDEGGLRLPQVLLGLVTVLAVAGLAARLAGGRAALLCALILLSFPLLSLQARQLTSELGTAAAGALILYGLFALRPIGASLWGALRGGPRARPASTGLAHLADDLLSLSALTLGLGLGVVSGGVLLGVVVPLAAYAAATGAGGRGLALLARAGRHLAFLVRRVLAPRSALGHRGGAWDWIGDRNASWIGVKSLAATCAALTLMAVLFDHAYDLGPLEPGTRQIFGKSLLPTGCYSPWLGGVWQSQDDLRILYDSSVEQIAFGTFPWGLAAPLAAAWLLASRRSGRRLGGALGLAWAAAAWLATEAFQRKVGFTIYAGFPALALVAALWLDGVLADATEDRADPAPATPAPTGAPSAAQTFPLLLALFFVLAALTVGKDLQAFPDRLTSLLIGDDAVKYPAAARWLWLPPRVWVLVLGLAIAGSLAAWIWRNQRPHPGIVAPRLLALALAATAALAAFWPYGWHLSMSRLLSSKGVFATYHGLRAPSDRLLIQGNLGNAPRYYARGPFEQVTSQEQVLAALAAPQRAFALVPAGELCAIYRAAQAAGSSLVVLDNDNPRTLLLSNSARGARDHNPLLASLSLREPSGIRQRPPSRIVFDDRIELVGWNVPAEVSAGAPFDVTLFYKILAPVGGTWRVFQHYDRPGSRFLGDHVPIDGRCPTSDWQTGDYIADRYRVEPSGGGAGTYDLWTGFFTGSAPSWQNMPVTLAPPAARDGEHRVKITSVRVR